MPFGIGAWNEDGSLLEDVLIARFGLDPVRPPCAPPPSGTSPAGTYSAA
jgi:hypothetical protein